MRKILLTAIIACLTLGIYATPTAKSIFFADSYMLRAQGVEANYWNPAKIIEGKYMDLWLPGANSGLQVSNNALDLDTYNFFAGRDTLFADDKKRILNKIDGSVSLDASGNISVFGITMGNTAISSSAHFFGKGELSEEFLRLALYGNTEDEYIFSKNENSGSMVAYTDITYGIGDLTIPFIPENYPRIKAGFSGSLLAGVTSIDTQTFHMRFASTMEEGATLDSEVILRHGVGGVGFKGMFGMYSEITPWLEAGLTLDNLFGVINWNIATESKRFTASMDSVYISDIDSDLFDYDNEDIDIGSFTTDLGTELRLAAMYKSKYASVSMDWVQGFSETTVSSKVGRLSLASEFLPVPFLPLSLGIALPNSSNPVKVSYGAGIKSKTNEISLAVQSFDSLIPGYKSKGIAFAIATRIWF